MLEGLKRLIKNLRSFLVLVDEESKQQNEKKFLTGIRNFLTRSLPTCLAVTQRDGDVFKMFWNGESAPHKDEYMKKVTALLNKCELNVKECKDKLSSLRNEAGENIRMDTSSRNLIERKTPLTESNPRNKEASSRVGTQK